jgi:hypothetical protein
MEERGKLELRLWVDGAAVVALWLGRYLPLMGRSNELRVENEIVLQMQK